MQRWTLCARMASVSPRGGTATASRTAKTDRTRAWKSAVSSPRNVPFELLSFSHTLRHVLLHGLNLILPKVPSISLRQMVPELAVILSVVYVLLWCTHTHARTRRSAPHILIILLCLTSCLNRSVSCVWVTFIVRAVLSMNSELCSVPCL